LCFLFLVQNEYEDLLRRAVVITHEGLKMNQSAFGLGQKPTNKKSCFSLLFFIQSNNRLI